MGGAASELGFMHSGAIVEGGSICKNNRVLFCPQSMSYKSQISEDKTCHFNIGQARNACLCFGIVDRFYIPLKYIFSNRSRQIHLNSYSHARENVLF